MHDPADFIVAPDHRINFVLAGQGREVAAIFFERLKLAFRIGIGHPLIATQIGQRPQNDVAFQTVSLKNGLERPAALAEQAEQQMFGADIIVLELAGLGLRRIQSLF